MRGDYAGAGLPAEEERRRLSKLAECLNPRTQRALRELGVRSGWTCLEIGAADGSMSRWLAERVAPGGRVVAADLDVRFMQDLDVPGLEVRPLDLRSDSLETDHYDLAYCRTLLLHLPDPAQALRKLVTALSPGGWLLVQEPDAGSSAAADLDHPDADAFARILAASYGWLRETGVFDPYFGRQLARIFAALDLEDVRVEGHVSIVRGGSVQTELYARTFDAMAALLRSHDVVSKEDLALVQRLYADPAFALSTEIQYVACGRRPRSS